MDKLAIINHHERDDHIYFIESGHKYVIDNNDTYCSVTTYNNKVVFNEFNMDEAAQKAFQCRNNSKSKYKNATSVEEIKEQWEIDRNKGTQLHLKCEHFYNQELPPTIKRTHLSLLENYTNTNTNTNDDDIIPFDYFINFIKDYPHLEPYRTEWTVYNEDIKICGSIDMVFKNDDDTVSIYDWKRTNNILPICNNYDKYAKLQVMCHIPDTKYWHNALQLNFYKYILETKYNKIVKDLYIVQLHPSNNNYILFKMPDLSDHLLDLINYRIETLNIENV